MDVEKLIFANSCLHITEKTKKIIFVYTLPKVGSTALVSTLRMFAIHEYHILHVHDETMLKVLYGIDGVTINDIIKYNATVLQKVVVVIDIYRTPIEMKISTFFEKIDSFHFNNVAEEVNNYKEDRVIQRFNSIFPHIALGDNFLDKLISRALLPCSFDFEKKYLLLCHDSVTYVKLRLHDSTYWPTILSGILGVPIPTILQDYKTENKQIKDLYSRFKSNYRVPHNFVDLINKTETFNYFNSEEERTRYFNERWKVDDTSFTPFTTDEFALYTRISLENNHYDTIDGNHYIDEGCTCEACSRKRRSVAAAIELNKDNSLFKPDKVIHDMAVFEVNKMKILQRNHFRVQEIRKNLLIISNKSKPKNKLNTTMVKILRKNEQN